MKYRSAGIVLVFAAIWLAIPSAASAQVGVLAGLNVTNVNFDVGDDTALNITGDRRMGFIGGVSFNIPLQDVFSVELDALFAQKGTEFTIVGETGKVKLSYLDVPVLGRLNLPGSSPVGVHLLFGPSFNFKLSEAFDPDEGDDTEDQFETVETSLVIGGGVHVSRFRIELRYGMGLSNIVKDSVSEGFFTGKNKVFSILVGI